jgi:hypothetical protein
MTVMNSYRTSIIVLVLALAQSARAQDDATRLKQEGTEAFLRKDWPTALQKFDEAYAISKDPAFLFNRARTLESMGDLPQAADAIDAFEKSASEELKAKVTGLHDIASAIRARVATIVLRANVTDAEVRINNQVVQKTTQPETKIRLTRAASIMLHVEAEGYYPCNLSIPNLRPGEVRSETCELSSRATRGLLSVTSTSGASVKIDGVPRGDAPFEGDLLAGTHQIELAREGYETYRSSIVVEVNKTKSFKHELERMPGLTSKWWFWSGIGVVLVGAGVTTYVLTRPADPTPGTIAPGVIKTGLSF